MSLLSSPPSLVFRKTTTLHHRHLRNNHHSAVSSLSLLRPFPSIRLSSRTFSSSSSRPPPPLSDNDDDEEPDRKPEPTVSVSLNNTDSSPVVPDEWGEKPDFEPESKFTSPDPPIREDEDEWGPEEEVTPPETDKSKNLDLKRCLVDTVYGSDFGLRASAEVRAEVTELVNQLEAANPVPNPTEVPALLNGHWVLLYTAFSELLPLLAVGTTPLLKVERISQDIDTETGSVENSTTLASPFATFSFSATASFDVRSPTRIQVQFKEASFKPPEIKSRFDLPENVDIFGQKITLSPVQQLLNPVQEAAAGISRSLYGLPPLKIPIPGERTSSWLIVTYLDEDFRISRGDGGLFVLIRDGSPLLDQ